MTECERIIQQGVLPENFFEEEERCGFLVTEKRKKVWAVLLDMLFKFDNVCKRNGLTYYLIDGSLLGAVRHKGFIPWDDDIDVTMPREDYEKLQTLGGEFSYPYFLQTPYTDPGYFFSFVKIRNCNTTGLNEAFKYQGFNQGMFLDVFPLDVVNVEKGEVVYNEIKELCISNSAYMRLSNPNLDELALGDLQKKANKNPIKTYEDINSLASQFNGNKGRYIAHWALTLYPYEKLVWYQEDFDRVEYWEFEGRLYPVPAGYDRTLRISYGNYLQYPPAEKRGLQHANVLFDPDKSYLEYLKSVL